MEALYRDSGLGGTAVAGGAGRAGGGPSRRGVAAGGAGRACRSLCALPCHGTGHTGGASDGGGAAPCAVEAGGARGACVDGVWVCVV